MYRWIKWHLGVDFGGRIWVGGLRAGWVWVEGMVTGEVGLKKGTGGKDTD